MLLRTRLRSHKVASFGGIVQTWNRLFTASNVPVVIIGAGPSGLFLSCLLSQYGVRHLVLDKSMQLTQHPQAHYINNRTMEVFRSIPGLSAEVSAASPPLEQWRKFIYCEGMATGQLLGQVDHFPGQVNPVDPMVSPEPVTHLSQHRLLPLLLNHAQQLSETHSSCADIHFGKTVTAVSNLELPHHRQQPHLKHAQSAALRQGRAAASGQQQQQDALQDGVAAQEYPVCIAVQPSSTARRGAVRSQQLIRCSYLVAADGAHSSIRQLLGIPMRGDPALQHLMSIHFSWPDLGAALLGAGRQAMLYFVFNRQLVAVVVAHDLNQGEFVAQVPYYPPLQSPQQFTADFCRQVIAAAAGWPIERLHVHQDQAVGAAGSSSAGFHLHSIKSWVMSALVADKFEAWGSRVLLVGDAAHRLPPAGGFGMNTGIQDAHNLAWKLAAVLSGTASHSLLHTYQLERQPVAAANTELSVNNWHEALRVPQALGLDPRAAALVNQLVAAAPIPTVICRWLLDSALAAGRGLAAAVTPLRKAALEGVLSSGQSLRLQFPKEDLGFIYQQGAVDTHCGSSNSNCTSSISSSTVGGHRDSPYVPSTSTGGRLPHCRLLMLDKLGGQIQRQVSTLDLVTPDVLGLNMLLICSSSSSNMVYPGSTAAVTCNWLSAGQQLQQQGWPLQVLQVLPQHPNTSSSVSSSQDDSTHATVSTAQQQQQRKHKHSQCQLQQAVDVEGSWARLHSGCSSAAVLVRPDGHVAWRTLSSSSSSSSETGAGAALQQQKVLKQVMAEVLCLNLPEGDSRGLRCI